MKSSVFVLRAKLFAAYQPLNTVSAKDASNTKYLKRAQTMTMATTTRVIGPSEATPWDASAPELSWVAGSLDVVIEGDHHPDRGRHAPQGGALAA